MKSPYVKSLILLGILSNGSATAAETITFSPGPDFTTRVHTSSGEFIVDVSPSGQTVWIGTEAEWTDRKARAVMGKEGYAEMDVVGEGPNEHHFVNTRLPSAQLGSTRIAEIMPSIDLVEEKYSPEAHAPPSSTKQACPSTAASQKPQKLLATSLPNCMRSTVMCR
jgi:hypothetical protein